MKHLCNKQAIVVAVLGMLVTAAIFALVITYLAYLPTIMSGSLQKSEAWLEKEFYRIARNGFFISGVSGLVLGFALPVIVKVFRNSYGKQANR